MVQQAFDVVVIGAGQAGLAAGYYLSRTPLRYTLLDANADVGGSWQHYWDSLRVFSPAKYSQLPGLDFPGDPHRYPSRQEVIAYLRDYADHFAMPVMTCAKVRDVSKTDTGFVLSTQDGAVYSARALVVAVGAYNRPYVPAIPGMDAYTGDVLHTYEYRRPQPFAGQRIVVVGANNSAVQVGVELAQVARVTLAVRRPIRWTPKRILGKSLFFWVHDTGFDMLPLGAYTHLEDTDSVLDDGTYRRAVESGQPDTRQMFTAFTERGVLWPDGIAEAVDTVVFATGYRPDNLPFLQGLGALCPAGLPLQRGGVSTTVDGLYYMGVFGQRTLASATLRGVGADAEAVVGHLWRYLLQHPTPNCD